MLPFLTAYDPLGGSSGSMDPLGALQTYSFACGFLLPGVTPSLRVQGAVASAWPEGSGR